MIVHLNVALSVLVGRPCGGRGRNSTLLIFRRWWVSVDRFTCGGVVGGVHWSHRCGDLRHWEESFLALLAQVCAESGAFDVQVGKNAVEPFREPPCGPAEEGHHSRDQGESDEEGVDEDTDRQCGAELFDHG